jgi:ribonuclease HII
MVGVDEVGYGTWAGPLIICALKFIKEPKEKFNDSKKTSEKKRYTQAKAIKEIAKWNLAIISAEEITKTGLAAAYKKGILEAIEPFLQDEIIIDGRELKWLNQKNIKSQVKGDSLIQEISAASIIAKTTRDDMMIEYAKQYPEYQWQKNKGYGTKEHFEAIKKYGVVPKLHRTNYKPLENMHVNNR